MGKTFALVTRGGAANSTRCPHCQQMLWQPGAWRQHLRLCRPAPKRPGKAR